MVGTEDEFCLSCGKRVETSPASKDTSKSSSREVQIIKVVAGLITLLSLALPWTNFTILVTIRTFTLFEIASTLQQLEQLSSSFGGSASYADIILGVYLIAGIIAIGGIITFFHPGGAVLTIIGLVIFGMMVNDININADSTVIGYEMGVWIASFGAILGLIGPYVVTHVYSD